MKTIMKNAVDHVYKFSVIKKSDPLRFKELVDYGNDLASA